MISETTNGKDQMLQHLSPIIFPNEVEDQHVGSASSIQLQEMVVLVLSGVETLKRICHRAPLSTNSNRSQDSIDPTQLQAPLLSAVPVGREDEGVEMCVEHWNQSQLLPGSRMPLPLPGSKTPRRIDFLSFHLDSEEEVDLLLDRSRFSLSKERSKYEQYEGKNSAPTNPLLGIA